MNTMLEAANQPDGAFAALAVIPFILFGLLYVAIIVFMFYVYGKIIGRSGYPWTWVFVMLVPILNIVMLCMFAFKEWPIERELAQTRYALQALQASTGQSSPYGGQPMQYGGQQPPYSGGASPYSGGGASPYGGGVQQPPYGGGTQVPPYDTGSQQGYGQPPASSPYGS